MIKGMEKEKNIIVMVNYYLKVNIYMVLKLKANFMLMRNWNMEVNSYITKNGMEEDMMKMVILYMN